jgi:hypothetical protein
MTQVAGAQASGDCKLVVCDGAGKQISVADPSDLPNDNNACTSDACNGMTPVNTGLPQGTSCGAMLVCGDPANPQCQGCNVASDCPGVDDECKARTCTIGVCGFSYTAVGTATAAQSAGDCQKVVCDGNGATKSVADNGDKPVDGVECTDDVCSNGVPANPPSAIDTVCSGSKYCDGMGACVQCNTASECPQPPVCVNAVCSGHVCSTANVANGAIDPVASQTSGDCKVVQCDGAGATKVVSLDGDVPNDGNACTADSCSMGATVFTPTASGTSCNVAPNKTVCDGATHCVQCVSNAQCMAPQTCAGGGVANSCGGTPKTCAQLGLTCGSGADGCGGTVNCNNGMKDGSETGVDCGGGGGCATKCGNGTACNAGTDCTSTFCADGVCCGSACAGTCSACTAALKGAGADGTCGPIKLGTDPDGECADQGAATCGTDGMCDGASACRKYANGTVCVAQSCSGSTQTNASLCNGSGTCVAGGTQSCGNFSCSGNACLNSCANDAACGANAYCSGGSCAAKKSNGTVCGGDNQCTNGHCVDGVCCDGACSGTCNACTAAL